MTVEGLKTSTKTTALLDVRTGEEFLQGHIPGSVNLPLFNEEERAELGILYKNKGRDVAMMRGLEIASPKLPSLFDQAKKIAQGNQLIIYCWRGGMRSKSVATILSLMDLSCETLTGGYKAYRHWVLKQFDQVCSKDLIVFDGLTGSGKTELLQEMGGDGHGVIDLEELASHRGSVFGDLHTATQPTQQQFENALAERLWSLKGVRPIMLEGESQRIGFVTIPTPFFQKMEKAMRREVEDTLENRVKRIHKWYVEDHVPQEQILHRLDLIKKFLGAQRNEELKELVRTGSMEEFIKRILTEYYDPAYKRCYQRRQASWLKCGY